MIIAMNHVGISVSNLERSLQFYRDLFGMDVVVQGEFGGEQYASVLRLPRAAGRAALLRLPGGQMQIELFEFANPVPTRGDPERPVCDHGITHFCIEVTDIESEYERLRSQGVVFHCVPQLFSGSGNKATYARDPDGNVFELWERKRPS